MASSSFRRCPTGPTPNPFKSSAVNFGRTVSSISFSRNAASYLPRPRLRSQTTMSMTALHIGGQKRQAAGGRNQGDGPIGNVVNPMVQFDVEPAAAQIVLSHGAQH